MTEFRPNPDFLKELFASSEVTELVYSAGGKILDEAERLASAEAKTGDFAASLSKHDHRAGNGRPISTVSAADPGALSIEFGTKTSPRHRFLGRALDAVRR